LTACFWKKQGGVEEGDGALCGFIREELGEGQAGVVIDGDVEELPAGAADGDRAAGRGDAMAGACDARELLDVEVEKFARVRAFVAHDRRRRGELREAEAMAAQEAETQALESLVGTGDLEARQPPAPQGEHTRDPERVGGSGGTCGARGAILKSREPLGAEAGEPFVAQRSEMANPAATCATGWWRSTMRWIISARLTAVSLALLWMFMRRWWLGLVCFHNPTFPSPRRMNSLLERHTYMVFFGWSWRWERSGRRQLVFQLAAGGGVSCAAARYASSAASCVASSFARCAHVTDNLAPFGNAVLADRIGGMARRAAPGKISRPSRESLRTFHTSCHERGW